MKSLFSFLILVFSFSCPLASMAVQEGGTDQGNGGDGYAAEFVSIAHALVPFVNMQDFLVVQTKDKFRAALFKVEVRSTERGLFLAGLPKDALNFPTENRILFSRPRWRLLSTKSKYALVLHEYFGVIGEENSSYEISTRVLASMSFGRPSCRFGELGAPRFHIAHRHMNSQYYTLEKSSYHGLNFVLRAEGSRFLLEAEKSGNVIASASASLDPTSLNSEISLRLQVVGDQGKRVIVNCASLAIPTRK